MAISGSLNFLSASEYGAVRSTFMILDGDQTDTAAAAFTPIDFVGLNTIIREPMTASENYLGQPAGTPLARHLPADPTDRGPIYAGPQLGKPGYYTSIYRVAADPPGIRYTDPVIFNALMLHRNGPYGYPMWKQYRGCEHPLSRYFRSNNKISIDENNPIPTTLENANSLHYGYKASEHRLDYTIGKQKILREPGYYINVTARPGHDKFAALVGSIDPKVSKELSRIHIDNVKLKQYYEPAIITKYKPLTYNVQIGSEWAIARQSLMNQIAFFSNPELNSVLRISSGDASTGSNPGETPFRKLKHEYYSLFHTAADSGARDFIYSERMYPRSINAYRGYKLKRPYYEETSSFTQTLKDVLGNSHDWSSYLYNKRPGDKRTFWKTSQGGGSAQATSDGTTRLRTDGDCRISISSVNKLWSVEVEDTAIKNASAAATPSNRATGAGTGTSGLLNKTTTRVLLSASAHCGTPLEWNLTSSIIANGIISNQHYIMSGTLNAAGLPTVAPYTAFAQLESYQPYEISALSIWPLDPRQDIYDKPRYLTSSVGGKGLQIGLTPHRANLALANGAGSSDYHMAGPFASWPGATTARMAHSVTGSILLQKTGSAGELVYSTKPTIFFYRTGSAVTNIDGYGVSKASAQYHRHTFPYNSPFYATNKIRGIDPFHDSYENFFGEMKHMGRDYSIVPEYNISDHILEHYEQKLPLWLTRIRDQNVFKIKEVKYDPEADAVNLYLPHISIGATSADPLKKSKNHKANFLTLPGAFVTASAQENFVQNTISGDLYKYLDISNPEGADSLAEVVETASHGEYGKTAVNHWSRDLLSTKFHALFGQTDNFKSFSNMLDQGGRGFKSDVYSIPAAIRFKCSAIKKMRIKDGFYPVTRTVQLIKEFDEAFLYHAGANPFLSYWSQPIPGEQGRPTGDIVTRAFRKSNGSAESFSGRADQAVIKQIFLEPLFGPGLLFNSIKSGIAVDWPIYASDNQLTRQPLYYRPDVFVKNTCDVIYDAFSNVRVRPEVSSSFNFGGLSMMGSSRCIPAILNEVPSHRLPFSALYDFEKSTNLLANKNVYLPTDFLDLDRSDASLVTGSPGAVGAITNPGMACAARSPAARYTFPLNEPPYEFPDPLLGNFSDELSHEIDNFKAVNYHSSINNFLCETMEFYLADAEQSIDKPVPGIKFPVIIPRNDTALPITVEEVDSEKKLFMEFGLSMGLTQVMCEGPRRAGIPNTSSVGGDKWYNTTNTKFGNTMRGYIYGPPIEIIAHNLPATMKANYPVINQHNITDTQHIGLSVTGAALPAGDYESYFYFNLQDPAYQSYTPPYFYGESSKILSYTPIHETDNYKDIWEIASKGISDQANSIAQGGSFYYERYHTGSHPGDLSALCLTIPNTASISSGSGTRMKIDASLEFSDAIPISLASTWGDIVGYTSYVTPWWTCPVLDFSSSYSAIRTTTPSRGGPLSVMSTDTVNSYHDYTTGRGMWGGYGTDPYDITAMDAVFAADNLTGEAASTSKGVYITVKDVFADSESEYNATVGHVDSIAGTPSDGFYTSTTLHSLNGTNTKMSASLSEKLGFKTEKYPIGAIARNKKVSEAIVIIPYLEEPITLKTKQKSGTYVEGYDIDSIIGGTVEDPVVSEIDLAIPGGELYSTREIIPGKHFLPIHKTLFNNILSLMLTQKYVPKHKRGASYGFENYGIMGSKNLKEHNENLMSVQETDVAKMIKNLIGDLEPHVPGGEEDYTHNLGLQIPPEFDFIHNPKVDPFQMMIIPFEHKFSKQDLVDMYQGVMPRIARFCEKLTSETTVKPSRGTPPHLNMDGANAETSLPPWLPYIPTGGISTAASFYKAAYGNATAAAMAEMKEIGIEDSLSIEMMDEFGFDVAGLDQESFIKIMEAFQAGIGSDPAATIYLLNTGGTEIHASEVATIEKWAKLFEGTLIDFTWEGDIDIHGSGKAIANQLQKALDKIQNVYNSYLNKVQEQLASPGGLPGNPGVNKIHLKDFGLENFLCPPLKSEIALGDHPLVTGFCDVNASTIPNWTPKEFYENIRFMVFKVKQRGAKDYKKYRERQIHHVLRKEHIRHTVGGKPEDQVKIPGEHVLENITFGEVYGSNWPYDYFSLLETIKIDVEIKVSK